MNLSADVLDGIKAHVRKLFHYGAFACGICALPAIAIKGHQCTKTEGCNGTYEQPITVNPE